MKVIINEHDVKNIVGKFIIETCDDKFNIKEQRDYDVGKLREDFNFYYEKRIVFIQWFNGGVILNNMLYDGITMSIVEFIGMWNDTIGRSFHIMNPQELELLFTNMSNNHSTVFDIDDKEYR